MADTTQHTTHGRTMALAVVILAMGALALSLTRHHVTAPSTAHAASISGVMPDTFTGCVLSNTAQVLTITCPAGFHFAERLPSANTSHAAAAIPMATMATTNTPDGRCHEDDPCWSPSFRPACTSFESELCTMASHGANWERVSTYAEHGACWQLPGDGYAMISCPDGFQTIAS